MLPKTLKYQSKVESASARSYRSNIQPQNGTGNYNLGDTIIINVPTRANLVMACTDSYLKFNIAVTNNSANASTYRWDSCGAHGIIQRIRVYSGSNLLEDIDNYGLLAKELYDLQMSTDSCYGKQNILCGTRNDLVVKPFFTIADAAGAVAALNNNKAGAYQINSGDFLTYTTGGVAVPSVPSTSTTNTQTYALNLISVLGSLCSNQYFPLFAATSAPIRLEIQLVDNINKAMCCTSSNATIKFNNVEYVANMIELSDLAMGIIINSLQGQPLQFVIPQYRNYASSQTTIVNGVTTQVSFNIAAKFSSLKSILVSCRDKGTGADTYFPFSSVHLGMTDYTFRIGPNVWPAKAPSTKTEMFAEVMKAVASIFDLNHQPSIEKDSYTMAVSSNVATYANDPSYATKSSGSFYIGIDLENYVSAPKETFFAGYNSNTDDIYLLANFDGSAATVTPRFDAFALFDNIIMFQNDTCYVKF